MIDSYDDDDDDDGSDGDDDDDDNDDDDDGDDDDGGDDGDGDDGDDGDDDQIVMIRSWWSDRDDDDSDDDDDDDIYIDMYICAMFVLYYMYGHVFTHTYPPDILTDWLRAETGKSDVLDATRARKVRLQAVDLEDTFSRGPLWRNSDLIVI